MNIFTTVQIICRGILKKIITTIKYLFSEGMALCGHNFDDGHFLNLLKLRAEYDTNILRALNTKHAHTYISSNMKNEILDIISHKIIKSICKQSNEESKQFGIIVDGT